MGKQLHNIPAHWEEITDILTEKGIKELKKGQLLKFDYEGSPTVLKVMKKNKGRVWARHIQTFTEQQLIDHDQHDVNTTVIPAFCRTCNVEIQQTLDNHNIN